MHACMHAADVSHAYLITTAGMLLMLGRAEAVWKPSAVGALDPACDVLLRTQGHVADMSIREQRVDLAKKVLIMVV